MKKLIICPKGFGNTYNTCFYVSNNSAVDIKVVNEKTSFDLSGYDTIILASGVYANHPHKNILKWLMNIQSDMLNPDAKIYLFLTWIGRGNSDKRAFNDVKRLLNEKGLGPEENYMTCFGKMGLIRNSHPDDEDYNNVLSWVTVFCKYRKYTFQRQSFILISSFRYSFSNPLLMKVVTA